MDIATTLATAIRHGDVTKSAEMAEILARQKSNLTIQVDEDCATATDNDMSIQICIEDREITGVFLTWKLSPSITISTLKMLTFERFGFPPEVQKWIVGKRMACDTDTLGHCNVHNNEIFYLYLMPARCVGLTRDRVHETYGRTVTDPESFWLGTFENGFEQIQELQGQQPEQRQQQPEQRQQQQLQQKPPEITNEHIGVSNGWICPACTYVNQPTRPGCEICSAPRPENFIIPTGYQPTESERKRLEHEKQMEMENEKHLINERKQNYVQLLALEEMHLVPNQERFICPICMEGIDPGNGVMLRNCLHTFCRECLIGQIKYSESSTVSCPYSDDRYQCTGSLQQREIQSLVPVDLYERHLSLSLKEAESRMQNTFHCQTPNCIGFCVYGEDANTFLCPICTKENCLTCKAIHSGQTCRQYQEDLKLRANNDVAARKTQEKIHIMLAKGDAMKCPTCDIIVMKKDGCDWIMCSMCRTEICWVTKGARWGPEGCGDTSGGCKCGVDGKTCHPNCQNCH